MVQHIKSLNHKDHRNLNLYSKCDLTFHYVHLYNIFKATLMLPREAPPQKKKKKKKKRCVVQVILPTPATYPIP